VLPDRLRAHVKRLAADIGERNVWRPAALEQAAAYVESALADHGAAVSTQEYTAGGVTVRNVEAELPGAGGTGEIVVVGAHYDTVMGCPGADDNGSGVAALIEIARLLSGRAHERTLRLVAFVNEEPPFFQTDEMGSLRYARRCRERRENVVAMLSLETIGYYTDAPHSQSYPPPLGLLHPHTGNFIALVGDLHSRALVAEMEKSFRRHADMPVQASAYPGWLPGVGWSDQWSFWETGYRAVMATDTAHLRNPAYHTPQDTPETLDYERFARVVAGLAGAVLELAGGG
jgi:Zn-dependent M28 family amino/carboxypeptidase